MDHVFTGIDTESVSYTHFKTYDENGEKAEAREFIVSGVSILLIATTQYNKTWISKSELHLKNRMNGISLLILQKKKRI